MFVYSDSMSERSLNEKLSARDLSHSYIFPAIALVELSELHNVENGLYKELEKLAHFLKLTLSDSNDVFVFMDGLDRIGILFSWHSKGMAELLQEKIVQYPTCKVNIGVGKPSDHLDCIYESYRQASRALQHMFYLGHGKVAYYDDIKENRQACEYPDALEKALFTALMSGCKNAELHQEIEAFYKTILQNGTVAVNEIYEISIRLLIGIEKRAASEFGSDLDCRQFDIVSIVRMNTLQEVITHVRKCLEQLGHAISQKYNSAHSSIIQKTIQNMEKYCEHATLHNMAQKVYMTPTYLSLLFKMNTGKTFIEQLTEIRMNKAKQLLRNTYLKNYEVAEKVGYQDSRYFSQIFKKKVGLSPSDYRESYHR